MGDKGMLNQDPLLRGNKESEVGPHVPTWSDLQGKY